MELKINLDNLKDLENSNLKIDAIKFQKMLLLYNSIEQGWSVKKQNLSYVFSKKHEGKKEILEDTYLLKFMKTNLDLNKIVS
jgi:predicted transposase YbfD/YdcC